MLKQLKFKKTYNWIDWGVYSEVKDQTIFKTMQLLQKKYSFSIIHCKLNSCFYYSRILIWCHKKDWQSICMDFCQELDGEIENVRF